MSCVCRYGQKALGNRPHGFPTFTRLEVTALQSGHPFKCFFCETSPWFLLGQMFRYGNQRLRVRTRGGGRRHRKSMWAPD
jgi:hypothetical protein